jgi:3-hydroxybutyryl-CoA dehydrogenase
MNPSAIGIVGSGTMGTGVALAAAQSGLTALLYETSQERRERATRRIGDFLDRGQELGKLTAEAAQRTFERIEFTPRVEDMAGCCLVLEALPEKLNLKREAFKTLDESCGGDVPLATNTSSLSVTAIAAAAKKPERILGLHFFNPAPLMALVEVVRGERTSERTVERAEELVRRLGKTPVQVSDSPGFIVNRIARPFYNEALAILGEGNVDIETIDRVIKEAGGFRMGPFELMDLIGVDVTYAVTESLYKAFSRDPRFRPSPIQRRMVRTGRLGRKTGQGFYAYKKS